MYHFIVNPSSRTGKARQTWQKLEQELKQRKLDYAVSFTEHPGHAKELAAAICEKEKGELSVIMVGGDGTANEIINGLQDYSRLTLGYIPIGSGNDLARGLGIPKDPLKALDLVLSKKHSGSADHGLLTYFDGTPGRRFGVSSGIGYDAAVCHEVQVSPLKRFLNRLRLGKLCYYIIAAKQIFTLRPVPATLLIDDRETVSYQRLLFVASMIQKYEGGGLKLAPSADNADHKLTLCILHDVPKLKLFLVLPSVLISKHTGIKGVEFIDCSSVEITTEEPMLLHTDGEPAGQKNHIRMSCIPEQVRMFL